MGYIQRKVHSTFLIGKAFWNADIDGEERRRVPGSARGLRRLQGHRTGQPEFKRRTFAFLVPLFFRLGLSILSDYIHRF